MSDFIETYPYASQAECKAAIAEQGLTNHYASGGRRDGVERYQIAEWKHEDRHGIVPAHIANAPVAQRQTGAKAICAAVFAELTGCTKAEFVAECVKRGVFAGTAKARFSDLVKK